MRHHRELAVRLPTASIGATPIGVRDRGTLRDHFSGKTESGGREERIEGRPNVFAGGRQKLCRTHKATFFRCSSDLPSTSACTESALHCTFSKGHVCRVLRITRLWCPFRAFPTCLYNPCRVGLARGTKFLDPADLTRPARDAKARAAGTAVLSGDCGAQPALRDLHARTCALAMVTTEWTRICGSPIIAHHCCTRPREHLSALPDSASLRGGRCYGKRISRAG